MSKKGTIITILLSILVMGSIIAIGGLFINHHQIQDGSLIAAAPNVEHNFSTTIDLNQLSMQEAPALAAPPVSVVPEPSPIERIAPPVVSAPTPSVVAPSVLPSTPITNTFTTGTQFWVQAGSFSTLARATAAYDSLAGLGLFGNIETARRGDAIFYRLRFGAWQSREEAARFRDHLRDQENLSRAFRERQMGDRSADFTDAYIVQSAIV